MDLYNFVKKYDLETIKIIEQTKDFQYIHLNKAWEEINSLIISKNLSETYKYNFLFIIIQTALISFQLSWKWENWWWEISNKILVDIDFLENPCSIEKWESFLLSCKNNRRLMNTKLTRLKKIILCYNKFNSIEKINYFYENMQELNIILSQIMNQNKISKTILFAVKMFWYWSRIIFEKFIPYPYEVQIPIDSRLEKIYFSQNLGNIASKKEILEYFNKLSIENNIPPLHLDWLLWIEYWYKHMIIY